MSNKNKNSFKLLINGEKVASGTQRIMHAYMQNEIFSNPFRTFLLKECDKNDYIIAGITNPIMAKLYKFILKSEEAQKVVMKSFTEILGSKASGGHGYGDNESSYKRSIRGDIDSICDLYNEIYGTEYAVNRSETWDGSEFQDSDWKRDEEKIKGKVKVPLDSIFEYQKMMFNHMIEQVENTIKKHGREECKRNTDKFKMTFPR